MQRHTLTLLDTYNNSGIELELHAANYEGYILYYIVIWGVFREWRWFESD